MAGQTQLLGGIFHGWQGLGDMLSLQQAVPALTGGLSSGKDTAASKAPVREQAPYLQESPGEALPPRGDEAECPVPGFDITDFDWETLVTQIRDNDPAGMESLYNLFSKGIRYYLCRNVGLQEIDDMVHDTIVIVVQAIRKGELREPERLMGYVRTVVRRQVANHIAASVQSRKGHLDLESGESVIDPRIDPENDIITDERMILMQAVLREITGRDQEILRRFYVEEHAMEDICADLGINETQFRLLKWRAKQRFGELGRQKMKSLYSPAEIFLRRLLGRPHL